MSFKPGTTLYEPKQHQFVGCGYSPCGSEAVCRVWTKTGWLNVCLTHYQENDRAIRKTVKDTA